MATSGTKSDNEWQRVVQRVTANDNEWYNEWQRVTTSGTMIGSKGIATFLNLC